MDTQQQNEIRINNISDVTVKNDFVSREMVANIAKANKN